MANPKKDSGSDIHDIDALLKAIKETDEERQALTLDEDEGVSIDPEKMP